MIILLHINFAVKYYLHNKPFNTYSPLPYYFATLDWYYYQCSEAIIGEATQDEQEWMDYFKTEGYVLLNKRKAVNSGNRTRYTEKDLITITQQYISWPDFVEYEPLAYATARKKGILDELTKHMTGRRFMLTKQKVKQNANKCSGRSNFCQRYPGSYKYATKHNMLDELFPR